MRNGNEVALRLFAAQDDTPTGASSGYILYCNGIGGPYTEEIDVPENGVTNDDKTGPVEFCDGIIGVDVSTMG